MKTIRGFEVQHFKDDYGVDCSIQESSAWEPHIWLGVHKPDLKIMWKDAEKCGIPVPTQAGWYDYPIPPEVHIQSRMHLTRKQAKKLAKRLEYFANHGRLKDKKSKEAAGNETRF